jgi:hypothetical protein
VGENSKSFIDDGVWCGWCDIYMIVCVFVVVSLCLFHHTNRPLTICDRDGEV